MANVNEILRDHVTLAIDCMDRIYLNGYIPNLQVPGQLVNFLTKHRGNVIPSPVLLGKIGQQFVQAVEEYAQEHKGSLGIAGKMAHMGVNLRTGGSLPDQGKSAGKDAPG